jgi:uncharacterized membrane protein YfcA
VLNTIIGLSGLFVSGILGGAINSVAGGGTLISFPSLVAFGVPSILANATNTAALCPGALSSALGYREDLPRQRGLLMTLLLPSLAGGLLGAVVLAITPQRLFDRIVPFLVLFATVLFGGREFFSRLLRVDPNPVEHVGRLARVWGFCFQLFVAAYGGYFGAGMGILMLASLGLMGLRDIHGMNAVKAILGFVINGMALIYFIVRGLVVWHLGILMAIGAICGGYLGARLAKRVDQRALRAFIVVTGLLVSVWLFNRG